MTLESEKAVKACSSPASGVIEGEREQSKLAFM